MLYQAKLVQANQVPVLNRVKSERRKNFRSSLFWVSGQASGVRSSTADLVIRLFCKSGSGKSGSGSQSCQVGEV